MAKKKEKLLYNNDLIEFEMETTGKDLQELTDHEIVDRVLQGYTAAYEKIMRKYNQRLFRIGISYLNDEQDVEDAMQNTYLKSYYALSSFKNNASFSTWLIKIMINECLQVLRKQSHYQNFDISDDLPASVMTFENGEEQLIKKEMKLLLERSILSLPQKYRTVYILREIEEVSTAETAATLNISESNVKARLYRAKDMLRKEIEKRSDKVEVFEFGSHRCNNLVSIVMSRILE